MEPVAVGLTVASVVTPRCAGGARSGAVGHRVSPGWIEFVCLTGAAGMTENACTGVLVLEARDGTGGVERCGLRTFVSFFFT